MKATRLLLLFVTSCILTVFIPGHSVVLSQPLSDPAWAVGLEAQQYPTGFIFTVNADRDVGKKSRIELRLGYNLVRHGDAGVHQDERGGGPGASVAWIRRMTSTAKGNGWILGGRFDVWFNRIDWRDGIGTNQEVRGETMATVLQPTAMGGYRFSLNNHWILRPTLAFGAEINVREKGGEVGEGAILLWGIGLLRKL